MKQLLIIVLLLSGTVFSETFVLELVDSSQTHNDDKKLVGTSEMRMRQVIEITRQKMQDEDRTMLRIEVLETTFNVEQEGEHLNYISDEFQSALDNMPDKRSISLDVDEDRLIATINNFSFEGKDWEQVGTQWLKLVSDGKLSMSDITATAYILTHFPLMNSVPQDILPGDSCTLQFPASRPGRPGSLSSDASPQYLICVGKDADNVTLCSYETQRSSSMIVQWNLQAVYDLNRQIPVELNYTRFVMMDEVPGLSGDLRYSRTTTVTLRSKEDK